MVHTRRCAEPRNSQIPAVQESVTYFKYRENTQSFEPWVPEVISTVRIGSPIWNILKITQDSRFEGVLKEWVNISCSAASATVILFWCLSSRVFNDGVTVRLYGLLKLGVSCWRAHTVPVSARIKKSPETNKCEWCSLDTHLNAIRKQHFNPTLKSKHWNKWPNTREKWAFKQGIQMN